MSTNKRKEQCLIPTKSPKCMQIALKIIVKKYN